MNRIGKLFALALLVAVAAHLATVLAAPYVLMNAAMKRISKDGTKINQWIHAPPTTEQSRRVVRPSPDIAYSACVYDLAAGPIHVTAAPWGDYLSVSVFGQNSDNIYVVDDRQSPQGMDLLIVRKGAPHPPGAAVVVESPSRRGIVLQRRLAPTQERWDAADAARRHDICGPLKG